VSVSQLNTCNQSNQLLAEPDAFYFVNRAHAGMEDECDLESWIYRPESAWGWLEDAEEIGTDDW
jgi:hypothetical protein